MQATEDVYVGQVRAAVPVIEQFVETESRIGAPVGSIVPPQDVDLINRVNRGAKPPSGKPGTTTAGGAAPPSAGTQRVQQGGRIFVWDGNQYVPE